MLGKGLVPVRAALSQPAFPLWSKGHRGLILVSIFFLKRELYLARQLEGSAAILNHVFSGLPRIKASVPGPQLSLALPSAVQPHRLSSRRMLLCPLSLHTFSFLCPVILVWMTSVCPSELGHLLRKPFLTPRPSHTLFFIPFSQSGV